MNPSLLPVALSCLLIALPAPAQGTTDASVGGKASAAGMAVIPAGRFTPLYRNETDPASVPVPRFFLDVLPVTNAEFLEFVRLHPQWRRSRISPLFADSDYLRHWAGDLELGPDAAAHAPVTRVSWFAARAFARSMGKRLPTVDEWECAAAASPTMADGSKDPKFQRDLGAWYATPAPPTLSVVGTKPPNVYGVHDLHGLVWEWVADFGGAMVTGDSRGDSGLDRQLFCAGGSSGAKDTANFPAFMRYGFRSSLKARYTVPNLGFRCARTPSAPDSVPASTP